MTHTPTPWIWINEDTDDQFSIRSERDDSEISIIRVAEDSDGTQEERDAEFIIRAVNAHDVLLAAVKDAMDFMDIDDSFHATQLRRSMQAAVDKAEGR